MIDTHRGDGWSLERGPGTPALPNKETARVFTAPASGSTEPKKRSVHYARARPAHPLVRSEEAWWRPSWHLSQCVDFLLSDKFEQLVTYLEPPEVPRGGQSETLINVWRQIAAVRRGFKTPQGQLDHLNLFQLTRYLQEKLPG